MCAARPPRPRALRCCLILPHAAAPPPQIAVGILLGVAFSQYDTTNLPDSIVYVALVLICIFVGERSARKPAWRQCMPSSPAISRLQLSCLKGW